MKFGKSLGNQIEETLPEWGDKFLSYKELKKRLKLIDRSPSGGDGPPPAKRPRLASADDDAGMVVAPAAAMTAEEEGFMKLLEAELDKFNTFFVEKEEEYIIRQKELQDRLRTSKDSKEEMMKVRKEIVDFHGEMVLLENYSSLNYTGLVKILKKYDKRTGALIRLPFIQKVLQEPFFTTDLLDKLINECESMLDGLLLPASDPSVVEEEAAASSSSCGNNADDATEERKPGPTTVGQGRRMPELEEIEYMESLSMKSTLAALRVLREIRSGSSTVSVFSLPPLQTSGVENRWSKIPVLEQSQVGVVASRGKNLLELTV